ncbi:male-specific lethal 3 homolog isoform X2 [Neocloeon triangulifer]|uniref:male-specific lethal 3 homolog isoform X2 n=1 Tax=Neocloeon triangulifer TaxID=2078957 RepID=UPI00286F6ADB|nr:male-specific lethal 3 homolog isoform X2 [Neocloeon triangulifer]
MDAVQSIDYIDGITLEMLVDGGDLLDETSTVLYDESMHYEEEDAAEQDDEDTVVLSDDDEDDDDEPDDEIPTCEDGDDDEWEVQDDNINKNRKVPLDLPAELKKHLEIDHFQVVTCDKLVNLPCNPCVNLILESYYREYACEILQCDEEPEENEHRHVRDSGAGKETRNLSKSLRLRRQRQRRLSSESSADLDEDKDFEEILRNLRICLEVLHSIRYYIDFTLGDHLLYPSEKQQHQYVVTASKASLLYVKQEPVESIEEYSSSLFDKITMLDTEDKSETEDDLLEILSSNDQSFTKRWNDFLGNDESEGGKLTEDDCKRDNSEAGAESLAELAPFVRRRKEMLSKIQEWKLVPDVEVDEDGEDSTPNSQIYGAVHLARLMVKLPEFLYLTKFPSAGHLKAVQRHLNLFINYLANKSNWFQENQYRTNHFHS